MRLTYPTVRVYSRYSLPKRAMMSMIIHVPLKPTAGSTPARMAKATAVGTAVSPVVMPARKSVVLLLAQLQISPHSKRRQLKDDGQPHDLAKLYGSSYSNCAMHGAAIARTRADPGDGIA